MAVELSELDRLRDAYKAAVDEWVAAIREEEALATADHSIRAWERWEQADFRAEDFREKANVAKEAYKDGLRLIDYDI